MTDEELLKELEKRAEAYNDRIKRDFAIEELKKIKAKIEKENEPYIRMWETGFDDVSYGKYRAYRKAIGFIVKHIDELEGDNKCRI